MNEPMAKRKLRLMHLDNDPVILSISSETLSSAGFEIVTTSDPEDLLGAAADGYDLFLADVMHPGVNGISLCHDLREAGWTGPILVVTSKVCSLDERNSLQKMDVELMVKPFGPMDLIQRVRQCVETHKKKG